MLLVKTVVKPSSIHGLGCFAVDKIKKGQPIAVFVPGFDLIFSDKFLEEYPTAFEFVRFYGYFENSVWCLNSDNMRYFNHSLEPNTFQTIDSDFASRDIEPGEELTCNYFLFDESAVNKFNS